MRTSRAAASTRLALSMLLLAAVPAAASAGERPNAMRGALVLQQARKSPPTRRTTPAGATRAKPASAKPVVLAPTSPIGTAALSSDLGTHAARQDAQRYVGCDRGVAVAR